MARDERARAGSGNILKVSCQGLLVEWTGGLKDEQQGCGLRAGEMAVCTETGAPRRRASLRFTEFVLPTGPLPGAGDGGVRMKRVSTRCHCLKGERPCHPLSSSSGPQAILHELWGLLDTCSHGPFDDLVPLSNCPFPLPRK